MNLRKKLLAASIALPAMALSLPLARADSPVPTGATAPATLAWAARQPAEVPTATPIKHLVVIIDEGVSFDHYFATYPKATNPPGEPNFTPNVFTPRVDNLSTASLLFGNPNAANGANGIAASGPFRLDPAQAITAQNAGYTAAQQAFDGGKMDAFPLYAGRGTPGSAGRLGTAGAVMGYYDGNAVTAIWNYAQHFAMSDNAYTDTFGASAAGALALVAGQTNGYSIVQSGDPSLAINDGHGAYTLIGDAGPAHDVCSRPANTGMLNARNIGDLLNAAKITWGGFMAGFNLNITNLNGTTGCARASTGAVATAPDYVPHHNGFQYFATTANPTHARPLALADIGYSFAHNGAPDPANHQYDLADFYQAVKAGNFPSVSYIKLSATQDGTAGTSSALDEQAGLVQAVNFIMAQPGWSSTAIIITYASSGGWYDHGFAPTSNPSLDQAADQLNGPGRCGTGTPAAGVAGAPVNGRCGPGARIPFLIISPWAKYNYVDHDLITQSSIVRFIEDNWLNGQRLGGGSFDATAGSLLPLFNFTGIGNNKALYLDPATGENEQN